MRIQAMRPEKLRYSSVYLTASQGVAATAVCRNIQIVKHAMGTQREIYRIGSSNFIPFELR